MVRRLMQVRRFVQVKTVMGCCVNVAKKFVQHGEGWEQTSARQDLPFEWAVLREGLWAGRRTGPGRHA